jgi:hypothetical protein
LALNVVQISIAESANKIFLYFLRRNNHLIRQKGVKFENKRAQWYNYLNMDEMYQEIYQNLCSAGIACKHPEALWKNKNGDVVEVQKQAFGS